MSLPKFLQPYLASYDLSSLDIRKDKKLIITEILNKGDFRALAWVSGIYAQSDIKNVLHNPTSGMWLKSILVYWLRIFGMKLAKSKFEKALINLNS